MLGGWLNPLHGEGYQFWSGIGSGSPVLGALGVWLHHHNCRIYGCWKLGHVHDGRPVCKRHHPDWRPKR